MSQCPTCGKWKGAHATLPGQSTDHLCQGHPMSNPQDERETLSALAYEHCFKASEMPPQGAQLYMFDLDRLGKLCAALANQRAEEGVPRHHVAKVSHSSDGSKKIAVPDHIDFFKLPDGAKLFAAQPAAVPQDCPKCKGSEIRGFKRGVKCSACDGTGEAAPQGGRWKWVPEEPTDAMVDATHHGQPVADIYRDMLAAAPPSPQPPAAPTHFGSETSATHFVLPAAQPPAAQASRPDILERLTYHALERDDLTLDECLDFLAHEWRKVHGRTDRQMVMQILALLAAQPEGGITAPAGGGEGAA